MIFHGMSSDFKKEECGDYLHLRSDSFKGVKRLINELHLWKLSSQPMGMIMSRTTNCRNLI